jgi:4-alpha-glucanotransferase
VDLGGRGVADGYWDAAGTWRSPGPEALAAVAAAVGEPEPGPPLWFVRAGTVEYLRGPADIVLEEGTVVHAPEALPPDLPPGYHDLVPLDGGPTTRLIVTPGRCHLPPDLRTWGWAVQLYAARSRSSWGIGDLADLRLLGRWARDQGAGVLALSPLHAPGPAQPQQSSPYYPSSRCFLNPLHLRVEAVPGAHAAGADLDRLATAGRALNTDRQIDRDRVWALKREALEAIFAASPPDPAFEAFRAGRGEALDRFATWCALADRHGNGWGDWPTELRHPENEAVRAFAAANAPDVRFHAWLQWCCEAQLATATAELPCITDLAVGVDPGGADAWALQDLLALDAHVGAPPDEFNTDGQDWGLPPFVPWRLRNARYEPFSAMVRAALRHAGGLRIDHVMGLFRLFWMPADGGPSDGTYVRSPAGDLLDILALESHRARAFVVGEDLGTVEDEVRQELADRNVLSYRLLWFEPGPPASYPEQALAAVTTHDLPTIAGLWSGHDPAASDMAEPRDRLRAATGVDAGARVDEVVVAAHRALAQAPSRVLLATLDDALLVEERPNMPGTVQASNWSTALPVPIEDLATDPCAQAIADALDAR